MDINLSIIMAFASIGVLDTIYLSYHTIKKTDVACWWFPKEWCHKVQHSPQSRTFGIPNSFAGLFMYIAILLLTLGYASLATPLWWLQTIIAFGFCFSFYFLYVQAFVLRAFCTWCVISAVNFLAMAVAIFLL